MKHYKKSDFVIKGRFTRSRLAGRENEFVYEIFWNGKQLETPTFTSKRKADQWLGKFVRFANEIMDVGGEWYLSKFSFGKVLVEKKEG